MASRLDKRITIDLFSDNGLKNLENFLDNATNNIINSFKEYVEPIVDEAVGQARIMFTGTGVSVEKIGNQDGFTISADGEDVCFIEFGAGDYADSTHGLASNVPFTVKPGSWSDTHSRQYTLKGFWWYKKQKYYYVMPHYGMLQANNVLMSRIR